MSKVFQVTSELVTIDYNRPLKSFVTISKMPRQPWGKGRAAKLKKKRNRLAYTICDLLVERLDHDQVQQSGELFPRGFLEETQSQSYVCLVWGRAFCWAAFHKAFDDLSCTKALPHFPATTCACQIFPRFDQDSER